jgi:hypothetical protein
MKYLLIIKTLVFLAAFLIFYPASSQAITQEDRHSVLYETTYFEQGCTGGGPNLTGNNNVQISYNFLYSKFIEVNPNANPEHTAAQAAGIVGNFMLESTPAIDPRADNGSHTGIAQWDSGRWANLVAFARQQTEENLRDPFNLTLQLMFVWKEMEDNGWIDDMQGTTTAEAAARKFEEVFERSGGQGMTQRIEYANQVLAQYGGTTPTDGGEDSGGDGGSCSGTGSVNAEGYAFPLEGQKNEISAFTRLPCTAGPSGCHHDGTPAFDLITGAGNATVGRDVYAIHDGTIDYAQDNYRGASGCFSIGFTQSGSQNPEDDGWEYWYGHIRRPTVGSDQQVRAGDKIAEVGESRCTGNGSQPHLHIDRGFPKGRSGGSDCCRDPAFIDLINALYEGLPG